MAYSSATAPNSIGRASVTRPPGRYDGTITKAIAARMGDDVLPVPAVVSTASRTRDAKDGYVAPLMVPLTQASRAPPIPATNAEAQKTSTLVVLTFVPLVVSASGESDIARSSRPNRLRSSATRP